MGKLRSTGMAQSFLTNHHGQLDPGLALTLHILASQIQTS